MKQIQNIIRKKRELDNCATLDAIVTSFLGSESLSELTGQRRQQITQIQDANGCLEEAFADACGCLHTPNIPANAGALFPPAWQLQAEKGGGQKQPAS